MSKLFLLIQLVQAIPSQSCPKPEYRGAWTKEDIGNILPSAQRDCIHYYGPHYCPTVLIRNSSHDFGVLCRYVEGS